MVVAKADGRAVKATLAKEVATKDRGMVTIMALGRGPSDAGAVSRWGNTAKTARLTSATGAVEETTRVENAHLN